MLGLRVTPFVSAAPFRTGSPAPFGPVSLALILGALVHARPAGAAEPVLVEFHFQPVPGVQMAIWLEDKDGKHVQDVLVTQATGKLGIGNRPGIWNFVSSWHEPYGPRLSVLPVWAHRRGKTYPKLVFFDDDPADQESLGWHENSSSAENYYCRPLTASENDTISVDTKTCPSPQVFQSDKGKFDPKGGTSVYPPRNDLLTFEPGGDSQDAMMLSTLNDLDAVTAATPSGDKPETVTALIPPDIVARGPLTAYIEVSLEHDENANYDYDREKDHFVDTRLENYGVEYLGQPSVVYKVDFDPTQKAFTGTVDWAGYGDWNGVSGALHPPDATISTDKGSGADRLKVVMMNGDTFRWGVFSYGGEVGGTDTDTTGGESDSGSGGGSGSGGDASTTTGGGWGTCDVRELAPITDLTLTGMTFDKVEVSFSLPPQDPEFQLGRVRIFHITGEMPFTEDLIGSATESTPLTAGELGPLDRPISVTIDQLWGDFTYQFGVVYEDKCTNRSPLVTSAITTPAQKFQTVDSFCFVATAAYGAPWTAQVQALRSFRDAYLKTSPAGIDLVRFYYAYSPPLAGVIQREPLLRGLARVVLQPVADAARLSTLRERG